MCMGAPSVCVTTCGDGVRAGAEECDDDNVTTDDGCDDTCQQQFLTETEPNETYEQALANGLMRPGFIYTGAISPVAARDYFFIRITTTSHIRIRASDVPDLNSCGAGDPVLTLFRWAGGVAVADDDNGPALCADINNLSTSARRLPPGDYVLMVSEAGSDAEIPEYYLQFTLVAVCGDMIKGQYEDCDGTPDCGPTCLFTPVCGNGRLEQGEQCEDGNTISTDGCDACVVIPTHRCAGLPSVCTPVEYLCNNGVDEDMDTRADAADADCQPADTVSACQAGESLVVFTAREPSRGIGDVTSVSSVIPVPAGLGTVRRVVVRVNVPHTAPNEVDITLESPNGTRVELASDNGPADGDGYQATVLDDACLAPITSAVDPFTGCFQPEQPLGVLAGETSAGNWTLTAADDTPRHTGNLVGWTLLLCLEP